MLNFAWPWMILLLPLPLLWLRDSKSAKQPPVILFPRLTQIKACAFTSNGQQRTNWRQILVLVAWALMVISLMRPQFVKDLVYANNSGYDLLLAVDLSRSMETVDFSARTDPISRIAATKKVVANFVKQRTGDRVGLIVFADQAFLTIPLTLDTKSVSKMLNNLIIGMAGERTAIGDAIGIGVQNLRKRPESARVLILLTDGDDTASHIPPLEAAKIAKQDGIKIYTIGVGHKLDEKLLKQIANLTGGIYYKVTNVNDLEKVYAKIDVLEKSEVKQNVLLVKTPLYHMFLLLALVLLGIVIAYEIKSS